LSTWFCEGVICSGFSMEFVCDGDAPFKVQTFADFELLSRPAVLILISSGGVEALSHF